MTSQIAEWFSAADPEAALDSAEIYPRFPNSLSQMLSAPLESYLDQASKLPQFVAPSPILRRGYLGTWEFVDGKLYLIELRGNDLKGETVYSPLALESLFKGKIERISDYEGIHPAPGSSISAVGRSARLGGRVEKTSVFADWYSGTLCLPSGKLLADACSGFLRVYERHRLIEIDCGCVTRESVQTNNKADLLNPQRFYSLAHRATHGQEMTASPQLADEWIHSGDSLSKLRRRADLIYEAKRAGLWLAPVELEVLSLVGIQDSDSREEGTEDLELFRRHESSPSNSPIGIRLPSEFMEQLVDHDQGKGSRDNHFVDTRTHHSETKHNKTERDAADTPASVPEGQHKFLKSLCPFCRGFIFQEERTCIDCGVGFPKNYEGEAPGSYPSTAPRLLSDEEPNTDSWDNAYKKFFDK